MLLKELDLLKLKNRNEILYLIIEMRDDDDDVVKYVLHSVGDKPTSLLLSSIREHLEVKAEEFVLENRFNLFQFADLIENRAEYTERYKKLLTEFETLESYRELKIY